jgi:integrase
MGDKLAVYVPESALLAEWYAKLDLDVETSDLSDASRTTYHKGIQKFIEWLRSGDFEQVSRKDVSAWKAYLVPHCKPNTINTWLTAIRSFYAWAEGEGKLAVNPTKGVKSVRRKGTTKRHLRKKLEDAEILRILDAPDRQKPLGKRDYALLCLKAFVPIRDVELHRADYADLSTSDGAFTLVVQPKGGNEKDEIKVVAHQRAQDAILEWIAERGRKPGPLFTSYSPRSKGERLTLVAIRHIVIRYYRLAGVWSPDKTSHSMRHSAITKIVKAAGPMKAREAAGHVSMDTTMIYYHEGDRLDDPGEAYIDYG